jgi:hypothetical protein
MKKIRKVKEISLKYPTLYRNDLYQIEEILKQLKIDELAYEDDINEYNSIEEIPTENIIHNPFYIKADYHRFLSFSDFSCRLSFYPDDLKTIGAFNEIVDIIKKRENVLLGILFDKGLYFVYIASILVFAKISFRITSLYILIPTLISSMVTLFNLLTLYFPSIRRGLFGVNYSKIEAKPNFYTLYKAQIWLSVFSAFIGIVFTYLAHLMGLY